MKSVLFYLEQLQQYDQPKLCHFLAHPVDVLTKEIIYGSYQRVPMSVILHDLEGHSQVAGLFQCNSSTICTACYKILNDTVFRAVLLRQLASCTLYFVLDGNEFY